MGTVQINEGKGWVAFCDKNWTKTDADVVCKHNRFIEAVEPFSPVVPVDGKGETREFICNGQEPFLLECNNNLQRGSQCSFSDFVGVRCKVQSKLFIYRFVVDAVYCF